MGEREVLAVHDFSVLSWVNDARNDLKVKTKFILTDGRIQLHLPTGLKYITIIPRARVGYEVIK